MKPVDPGRDTRILMDERGLTYGDGLFETMRAEGGRLPLLERHLDRLLADCHRLHMPIPDRERLAAQSTSIAAAAGGGVVKIIVTRGAGARGYRPPQDPEPRVMIEAFPLPEIPRENYTDGVSIQICSTRIGRSSATAGIKHLGRLEQVLASSELQGDCAEGLMLDEHGHVIEGTRCNLLLARDGVLSTPRLEMSGVAGVMRSLVLETAEAIGVEVREEPVMLGDLERADEVLLTNAVIGVWPVNRIDSLRWRRSPGAIGRRLMVAVAADRVPAWAP